MDVVQVLYFFDVFHANHKNTCGAERLDVSAEREPDAIRVTAQVSVLREDGH